MNRLDELRATIARIEARGPGKPRTQPVSEVELIRVRGAVALEVGQLCDMPAEYIRAEHRLCELGLGPIDRVDLALKLEERLTLTDAIDSGGCCRVADLVKACAALLPAPAT